MKEVSNKGIKIIKSLHSVEVGRHFQNAAFESTPAGLMEYDNK